MVVLPPPDAPIRAVTLPRGIDSDNAVENDTLAITEGEVAQFNREGSGSGGMEKQTPDQQAGVGK
jgi:hypothetical protein